MQGSQGEPGEGDTSQTGDQPEELAAAADGECCCGEEGQGDDQLDAGAGIGARQQQVQ